jgi:hypothetical protein
MVRKGRPPINKDLRLSEILVMRLTRNMFDAVDQAAEARNISMSEFVRRALEWELTGERADDYVGGEDG